MEDDLVVNDTVRVPRRELEVTFSTSGGPGGQHANRSATRVEIRLDLTSTTALDDEQRRRSIGRLGDVLVVVADDERSQRRNRDLAERRLAERLRDALHTPRSRRPTRPTAGSRRRRAKDKQQRSELKRSRRRPAADD